MTVRVTQLGHRSLLSILLSIGTDIIRRPGGAATADHDVRQRFTDFLPDFFTPSGCLISVRSEVQLLDDPSITTYCPV